MMSIATALLMALGMVGLVRGQSPNDLCNSDFVTNGTVTDALCGTQYAAVRATRSKRAREIFLFAECARTRFRRRLCQASP